MVTVRLAGARASVRDPVGIRGWYRDSTLAAIRQFALNCLKKQPSVRPILYLQGKAVLRLGGLTVF